MAHGQHTKSLLIEIALNDYDFVYECAAAQDVLMDTVGLHAWSNVAIPTNYHALSLRFAAACNTA